MCGHFDIPSPSRSISHFANIPSRGAIRFAPRAFRRKWIPLGISLLLAASGCARLKRDFTIEELTQRHHYSRDTTLEELVDIAVARGYEAVNGGGQTRKVLELSKSDPGAVHRQFFEVQQKEIGFSDVFFLENQGSIDQTEFKRFPNHLRKDISTFLKEVVKATSGEYKPLLVRQEKLARKMMIYETGDGGLAMEFTLKVVSLERSILYGLFHLPHGPFIFFGKESQEVFQRDFLEADNRYDLLVQRFLGAFRHRSTL
jgi:hypothetical protein